MNRMDGDGENRSVADDAIAAVSAADFGDDRFRLLAENIPSLCWMAEADGFIFWYNRRWHDYCGSTPEQMEGWGWKSVHDPDMLPSVLEKWAASIATGEPFEMIFPLRGADGSFRPFLTRAQSARESGGKVTGWFGVNIDLSEQVEAERKLQAAAAKREAIIGQLGEGVIITDPEGRITFVNDSAARLHGVARLDVEPDEYSSSYHLLTEDGEPHPTESLPLTRAVRGQEVVVDARWRIRRPNGSEVLAMGNARPVHADDGSVIGAVLTIRDDTQRHAAEVALAEMVKVKDVLLHEVNHRVTNSLQLVTSLLVLQAGKTPSIEARQSLLEAKSRIAVVASMHRRLYTTGLHDRVDLSIYLRELSKETVEALDAQGRVTCNFNCPVEIIFPLDKAVPLALVISELLTNAVKYAFADGRAGTIDVTVRSNETAIEVSVEDDGVGLPVGFDLLRSSGLGMRIISALTRQLKGKVELIAKPKALGF